MEPPDLLPPLRFACVEGHIYRGGYPTELNKRFLERLRLRSILSLTPEPISLSGLGDVHFEHIISASEETKSKKKKSVNLSHETVYKAMKFILNAENQPVFVHCMNGQQVTGLIVACIRRQQGRTMSSILAEFERYSECGRGDIAFVNDHEFD